MVEKHAQNMRHLNPGRGAAGSRGPRRPSDAPSIPLRAPGHALHLLMVTALTIGWSNGCISPGGAAPSASLTADERAFYQDARWFEDVFYKTDSVTLQATDEVTLSARPLLKAIDLRGRYIILDKLNVRNIHVFDASGFPLSSIGSEGKSSDQYVYPHTVAHAPEQGKYYVYDADLLRVMEFDSDYNFLRAFPLLLYVDQLLVTPEGRLFTYTAASARPGPPENVVYEVDQDGNVVNSFERQSERYYDGWAASEAEGLAYARGWLYVITPYEYAIAAYDLSGGLGARRTGTSPYYVPPSPPPDALTSSGRFADLREYHESWSHIRQLIVLDERLLGVVYADPGENDVLLDLYDLDLTPLVTALRMPPHLGDVLAHDGSLYLLTRPPTGGEVPPPGEATTPQPVLVRYSLLAGDL